MALDRRNNVYVNNIKVNTANYAKYLAIIKLF